MTTLVEEPVTVTVTEEETPEEEPVMEDVPIASVEDVIKPDAEDETGSLAETVAEADEHEAVKSIEDKIEEEAVNKASCFDLSALACCGFSAFAAPTIVTPDIEKEEQELIEKQKEQERIENEKATQIQTQARGKMARDMLATLKAEKAAEEEAKAAAEAEAKAAAEAAAAAEAEAKAAAEAEAAEAAARAEAEEKALAEAEAARQAALVPKSTPKKGFMEKLRSLFQGCKKADKHVEQPAEQSPERFTV